MQPGYFHPYFIPIYAELFMPSLHATREPICKMRSGKMGIENGQWREFFDENCYITTRSNWYFVGYQQLDVFSFVYFWFYTCTFGYILHQKWALYVYFWAQTTAKLGYTTAILGNRIRIIKQRNRIIRQENFHCQARGLHFWADNRLQPLSSKTLSATNNLEEAVEIHKSMHFWTLYALFLHTSDRILMLIEPFFVLVRPVFDVVLSKTTQN